MSSYVPYIIIMAVITYLIRMLPLTFFRKEITSVRIRSFLFYMPYAVLGAMTFPAIFTATAHLPSSLCGTLVAVFFAYRGRSLLFVAAVACLAAGAVEVIRVLLAGSM